MSFKKNKYQVIRGAISKEVADIAYRYLQISADADNWTVAGPDAPLQPDQPGDHIHVLRGWASAGLPTQHRDRAKRDCR